jgi:hypothetical protein
MKRRTKTRTLSGRSKVALVGTSIAAVLALTAGTIAAENGQHQRPPKTYRFSGDQVGTTVGLPIDTNDNGHMATITRAADKNFMTESFGETDQLPSGHPDRFCTLPNGQTGVRSTLASGGGQTWSYPKTSSQLWVQTIERELCAGQGMSTFHEESEIIGGYGKFQGATGTITATGRPDDDQVFQVLGGGVQLTAPQIGFAFVAVSTHYEMEFTVPR